MSEREPPASPGLITPEIAAEFIACGAPDPAEDIERTAIQAEGCTPVGAIRPSAAVPERPDLPLTDLGNAERLERRHGRDIRYAEGRGWLAWDGRRWRPNEAEVQRRAVETVRSIYSEASNARDSTERKHLAEWATKSEANAAINAMIARARFLPSIHTTLSAFDDGSDAPEGAIWRFNVKNGTIDLRTGELHPFRREDMITRLAPVEYHPDATCPTWDRFLCEAQPDPEIRAFLACLAGYSLTGSTRDHVLPIHYGKGRNGKSTYNEIHLAIMGDYGRAAPQELMLEKKGDGHPVDRATLHGCRYASASETDEGRALSVALVKQLTGGDTISARFMRENYFQFKPTHKLALLTNHRPSIRDTTDSIWSRVMLIPWDVSFKGREDTSLPDKLRGELSGILAAFVRGCLEWQRIGLNAPPAVLAATVEYRQEEDRIGEFIHEKCQEGPELCEGSTPLYNAYKVWTIGRGGKPLSHPVFSRKLADRDGLSKGRDSKDCILWKGIALNDTCAPLTRREAPREWATS
jgi:putative DNA primase/helicase